MSAEEALDLEVQFAEDKGVFTAKVAAPGVNVTIVVHGVGFENVDTVLASVSQAWDFALSAAISDD